VVSFHSLLENLKSVVVKVSSCHVFYVIKTNPFLSLPSPLNLFFPSNTQLVLLINTQLVLLINSQLILPHFADSYAQTKLSQSTSYLHLSTSKLSSISLDALPTTTEEVFWSERSTAAKLMAPNEVDTIRLWTVVKPFRSLRMWDEALARRLFHPSTAYQTLQIVSGSVFTIFFALLQDDEMGLHHL
jgi:hypothetical protein